MVRPYLRDLNLCPGGPDFWTAAFCRHIHILQLLSSLISTKLILWSLQESEFFVNLNKTRVMQYEELLKLMDEGSIPDDLPQLLQALLLDAAGDWDNAHRIAQSVFTAEGSWVHAYLHRKEGDLPNASYWYHSAGRNMPGTTLEEEWETIARVLIRDI